MNGAAILIIDDEERLARNMASYLEREGHAVRMAFSAEQGLAEVADFRPDLVLLDLRLPGMDGLEALRRFRELDPDLRIVMMTAHGNVQNAVDALKAGAYDYVTKPLILRDLKRLVDKISTDDRIASTLSYYQHRDARGSGLDRIVGASPTVLRLKDEISRLAQGERQMAGGLPPPPVLVVGETGTGKELIARAIHFEGPRAAAPFIEINCAALPAALIEDELFGHERGAFTDAKERKLGLVEAADGGTLFLDEIGDMDLSLQAKVLRLLEDRRVRRLGAVRDRTIDVRIVAATNQPLEELVRAGRFRTDLYFRLRIVALSVPSLRERGSDVQLLARHFLAQAKARYRRPELHLSPHAEQALGSHHWPGNVRELRNVMEHAALLAPGPEIGPESLILSSLGKEDAPAAADGPIGLPEAGIDLEAMERSFMQQALERTGWNVTAAAKLLGLGRDALRYRVEKLALTKSG
ncbi:MAG TPA: sigma-54 dependent transcriptional regulator [Geminicoccus sp.]|uniref:sigma-54-dependent transcriptional regulator n=1 Tax=Geminicoccus sp. TaxID=2024832 RepID=UPI002BD16A3A|nr:sigma-54 dependent transcriptional regulator [Geminicoccus sp.]HWL70735.1 sigma-54 dependent transcriptional regulator [Geminicoccus sp.]